MLDFCRRFIALFPRLSLWQSDAGACKRKHVGKRGPNCSLRRLVCDTSTKLKKLQVISEPWSQVEQRQPFSISVAPSLAIALFSGLGALESRGRTGLFWIVFDLRHRFYTERRPNQRSFSVGVLDFCRRFVALFPILPWWQSDAGACKRKQMGKRGPNCSLRRLVCVTLLLPNRRFFKSF